LYYIFLWILSVYAIGLIFFPFAFLLLKRLPDRGASLSKIFGLLVFTYILWILGYSQVVPLVQITIILVMLIFAVLAVIALRAQRFEIVSFVKAEWLHLLISEIVFLVVFFTWILVVSQVPDISHTEKPMDFGFLNAIIQSNSFPPEDMWLSGESISYYYFGHMIMANLSELTSIPSNVSYNLSLVLVPALASIAIYGLMYNLIRTSGARINKAITFSLLGPIFLVFFGHLVGGLDFLQAIGWGSDSFWEWVNIDGLTRSSQHSGFFPQEFNWWWRDSRVINTIVNGESLDYTITEFPFFSFLLGDLHAHVMALPFLILAISVAFNTFLGQYVLGLRWFASNCLEFIFLCLVLGSLVFLNVSDFPVFATLFFCILFMHGLRQNQLSLSKAVVQALMVMTPILILSIVMYLPFYLTLRSQISGFLPLIDVSTRTLHFLLIWGFPLIVGVIFLINQLGSLSSDWKDKVKLLRATIILTLIPFFLWICVTIITSFREYDVTHILSLISLRSIKLLPLFIIVWIAIFSGLVRSLISSNSTGFVLILMGLAFYLLIGVELFYVNDFLFLRMNTIFKLYYQVWLLFSVVITYAIYYLFSKPIIWRLTYNPWRYGLVGFVMILFFTSLYYPIAATKNRVESSDAVSTLDGLAFLKNSDRADEYEAIRMLRDEMPKGYLLEAVGGSYTEFGRVSAATGFPAPLNWPGHELQWRGSMDPQGDRETDVKTIYTSNDLVEVSDLLDKYDVRYVYVGSREKYKYGTKGLSKFQDLLVVSFELDEVVIYERID